MAQKVRNLVWQEEVLDGGSINVFYINKITGTNSIQANGGTMVNYGSVGGNGTVNVGKILSNGNYVGEIGEVSRSYEILTKIYNTAGQPYSEYGFTFNDVSDVRSQPTDWLNQFDYSKWIWMSSYTGIHNMEKDVNINYNTLINKLGVSNFNGVSITIAQGADASSGYWATADSKITITYTDNSTDEYTNIQANHDLGSGTYTKDISFENTKTVKVININLKGYDSDNGWSSIGISEITFF